jgi:hypothetical protein
VRRASNLRAQQNAGCTGIQVFDADGRYLTVFRPDNSSFGMVFNDKNELFVAARQQVLKLVFKSDQ